jgi:phosphocarrier protein FPr
VVGIVVVSHSRALARAAVALAEEMVHGKALRIAVAAGLDERTFGTDAVAISEAIAAADQGDGVVVLMDLGSAVLSAELALDLMDDDEARGRVTLCPAPLVEGLVVAAVAAAGGAGRAEIAAEAAAALAGKQSQLGGETNSPGAAAGPAAAPVPTEAEVSGTFTVTVPHGLHARPAARLVQEVRSLDAQVRLRNLTTGAGPVPASSLSRMATLGALSGHEVEVTATGSQAREALDHVLALARRNFDEGGLPAPAGALAAAVPGVAGPGVAGSGPTEGVVSGSGPGVGTGGGSGATGVEQPVARRTPPAGPLPASPGIGVGPAWLLNPSVEVPAEPPGDPAVQWRRLREALAAVRREIQRLRTRAVREIGDADAAIFDAHLLLLDDTALLDEARSRLDREGAAPAWAAAVAQAEGQFEALSDPYLRARAADVRAVGDQVLRALLGVRELSGGLSGMPPSAVVVAPDLTPAQAAQLDPERIAAVVMAFGSPTAHSAILARARGIPALVAAGERVLELPAGTVLAVDGGRGELVIDPTSEVRAEFAARAEREAARAGEALARAGEPAVTRDGVTVVVAANVGSLDDARTAAAGGAEGAGLVRSEFLFLHRAAAPDVEEQEKAYLAIAEAMHGNRITLRTLDVGGDKPLDYVPMPAEANPFLGVRGLRLLLARPQLFRDQLVAIVRVARRTPVSVMFPMVSAVSELLEARAVLDDVVRREGGSWPSGLEVGIMVEVPAAALKARAFAPHVDFLSIGTNDLTQYTLAAERGNDATAALGDPLDPAVLHLVAATCAAAGPDTLVAVCGELAADERAVGVLVGLGVRELSVSPLAVPAVKQAVRDVDVASARELAIRALEVEGPDAVRQLLHPLS